MMKKNALVYLGPTLSISQAKHLIDADFRPPIKRGDLEKDFEEHSVVLIIDGEFRQSLSVSPKEILRLIDKGVKVVGASSMGALRAAELWAYGMEGYGWVYNAYQNGLILRDDEVALTYSPTNYKPLTIPLVNIRYWLGELRTSGLIDLRTKRKAIHKIGNIFYAERTHNRVYYEIEKLLGRILCKRLLNKTCSEITDIKKADAIKTLQYLENMETTIN